MKTNTLDLDTQALQQRILDLAMRGKLVKQDPNDEPASVLLEKIKAEKVELFKDKKIKKKDLNSPKLLNNRDLPNGWIYTNLKEITTPLSLNDGDWILSKNMSEVPEVKLIQLGSIGNGKYIDKGFKYITKQTFKKLNCKLIKPGYLLVNRLINKGRLMATILPNIEGELITAVDVCWIAPSHIFEQQFLMYQLLSPRFQKAVNKLVAGSTRKRISKGNLINIPIYLPPLSEQKRIAAKIDQLFALIQKIETAAQQYDELKTSLKSKVLDLAMQGKLVKQDSNDEPASELLNQIEAEKAQLIKEKKIKRSKPLPEITDEEKPFDIPDSWEWVRLGMIGTWAAGGTPSRKHPEYYGGNIPWLKTGDLNDGIVTKTTEKITKLGLENSSVKLNKPGNILIAMYGATIGKLGVVGDQALVTNQACCGCTTYHGIYNWYLFYYLLASRRRLIELGSGGAQPNISKKKIEDFVFPLPPLSEQKQIVAKIEDVFATL